MAAYFPISIFCPVVHSWSQSAKNEIFILHAIRPWKMIDPLNLENYWPFLKYIIMESMVNGDHGQ